MFALIKASVETLGLQNLAKELRMTKSGTLYTDSSAAKGAIQRSGTGRMKHIEAQHLWVQEMASKGALVYKQIPRSENYADLFTKHWEATASESMFSKLGLTRVG